MQLMSCHNGQLHTLGVGSLGRLALHGEKGKTFRTGLQAIDSLLPEHAFERGVVHEILSEPCYGAPLFFAAMLARAAGGTTWDQIDSTKSQSQQEQHPFGAVVWSDPHRQLYPPALAGLGIDLSGLYLLYPKSLSDEKWAIHECLGCKGVTAVVAQVADLSQIEARRFQLAAECGGSTGLLLRPMGVRSTHYAAATRWLVKPHPGERLLQRWEIQLIHGHGGRIGQRVILEQNRDTYRVEAHSVRTSEKLAGGPPAAKIAAGGKIRRVSA